MKATMSPNGVITLVPESGTEAFALRCWADKACIQVDDVQRNEQIHLRGSMLIVNLNDPTNEKGDE